MTTLIQSSDKTRRWLSEIRENLSHRGLIVSIVESKYWAAFHNDKSNISFSHCNPTKQIIRIFLPFHMGECDYLTPTPSSKHWAKKYPTIFTLRDDKELYIAVDLLEKAYFILSQN